MRYLSLMAFAAAGLIVVPGCAPDGSAAGEEELAWSVAALESCGETQETDLVSGRRKMVRGSVEISNDAGQLYVRIEAAPGFALAASQLAGAYKLEDIPQVNGNPVPGHFDTKRVYDVPKEYDEWVFELGAPVGTPVVTAAHVELVALGPSGHVIGHDSAWADGFPFPGKSFALWNTYVVQGCDEPPGKEEE